METELKIIRGSKFENEVVDIDGIDFQDCAFANCELTYSGGMPFLFTNSPATGCEIVFQGAAMDTLDTLSVMYSVGMQDFVEATFDRVRNPFQDTVQ